MGTSLTGLTPSTTYDALIKVGDNGPLSATAKVLSDGLGNDSILALSTSKVLIGNTSVSAINETLNVTGAGIAIEQTDGGVTTMLGAFGSADTILGAFTNNDVVLRTNNTERMRITSAGNVGIGTASPSTKLVISNAGAGGLEIEPSGLIQSYNRSTGAYQSITLDASDILFRPSGTERGRFTANGLTFNGDTAAANALDDYEEGTWTMGVSFGGGTTGITYATRGATYTKIGRQVTVNGYMNLSSKGSSTGSASITGLPFTIGASLVYYSTANLWMENVTFANQFTGVGTVNTTNISLEEITVLGSVSLLTNSDFANNSSIIISFSYFV